MLISIALLAAPFGIYFLYTLNEKAKEDPPPISHGEYDLRQTDDYSADLIESRIGLEWHRIADLPDQFGLKGDDLSGAFAALSLSEKNLRGLEIIGLEPMVAADKMVADFSEDGEEAPCIIEDYMGGLDPAPLFSEGPQPDKPGLVSLPIQEEIVGEDFDVLDPGPDEVEPALLVEEDEMEEYLESIAEEVDSSQGISIGNGALAATFIISSQESAARKDADVKDRDEGIASAISEERPLADALCSRPIPDEIVKVAALALKREDPISLIDYLWEDSRNDDEETGKWLIDQLWD